MLDFEMLVGMDETEAETKVKEEKMIYRIMKKDDQDFMGSMDVREDRVNLEVVDGKVVRAYIG